jgi:hypothetical protein
MSVLLLSRPWLDLRGNWTPEIEVRQRFIDTDKESLNSGNINTAVPANISKLSAHRDILLAIVARL